jgi:hypothetical protein
LTAAGTDGLAMAGMPKRSTGFAGALAAEMENAIADDATILPEHRIMGHFDLASFWDRRGDTDRAFRCWQRGHDVLARAQPFDRARCTAFIDACTTPSPDSAPRR